MTAALLALAGAGCQTQRSSSSIPVSQAIGQQDERTARIGEVVRETMRKQGIPGVSVAVIDHGKLVWAQGFGWRDVHQKLPVDTDTQFQAGSISKPVTALGVLRLEAAGKVNLDQDVNTYLKGWQLHSKFTNGPVTLRELLCHRAGLTPHGYLGYAEWQKAPTLLEVLNRNDFLTAWLSDNYFGPIKVIYSPGTHYRYSGGGYTVVQKAVEDVTGAPFNTAMRQLVLDPLEMSRSNYEQPPTDTNDIACGYGWVKTLFGGGRWRIMPQQAMGGLWTTPQDLARFIIALQTAYAGTGDGPVSPAMAREMLTPQFDGWQGVGVRLSGENDQRAFYHFGVNLGYSARMVGGVTDGRGIVIMSNTQKNKLSAVSNAVAREMGWKE